MILYLLDKDTFLTKAVQNISSGEFAHDIDFSNSSTITLADYIESQDGDFAMIKDGADTKFFGICKETSVDDSGFTMTLKQAENMFDTTIYKDNEDMIASVGIEDYIVRAVKDNFTESGDTLMDLDYCEIYATTHTPIAAKISTISSTEGGCFNFKTFLGNCLEYYGVVLDFYPENGKLTIEVSVKSNDVLNVDTKLAEIAGELEETYSVDVLARLRVIWKLDDDDENPTERFYYLRSDRTVTDNKNDSTRVDGTVKTICVTAESYDEMYENVTNEFKSNSYSHQVKFNVLSSSQLYDVDDFYIGRNCRILTEHQGIVESIVTKVEQSEENYISVTLGKLPVTLTEKIRKAVQ